MHTRTHTHTTIWLTSLLLLWDAHDLKGIYGLLKQVPVLLAWDGHVAIGQEAILAVVFQTQLGYEDMHQISIAHL